jgi:F-type H+-transporting ATPase subunit gamma
MPALIDIRRRIRSVKNTQQITKAMKMVSAAKLRRAQEAMFAARPYARKMMEVLNSLAGRAQPELHPLLQEHGDKRVLLVVVTSDKGLCGGFNTNILRTATRVLEERADKELAVECIGRKGRDYFKRRKWTVRGEHLGVFQSVKFATAKAIADDLIQAYQKAELDQVYLLYNEFKSVIQQRVVVERLLPIERLTFQPTAPALDYVYEPAPARIFETLLPRHVEVQVYRALLESAAAEQAARMTAMDAATRNSSEMIDQLTLYMNKVRQAAITREIIEVVSGAQAL